MDQKELVNIVGATVVAVTLATIIYHGIRSLWAAAHTDPHIDVKKKLGR